jgi:hypothetical protein
MFPYLFSVTTYKMLLLTTQSTQPCVHNRLIARLLRKHFALHAAMNPVAICIRIETLAAIFPRK